MDLNYAYKREEGKRMILAAKGWPRWPVMLKKKINRILYVIAPRGELDVYT